MVKCAFRSLSGSFTTIDYVHAGFNAEISILGGRGKIRYRPEPVR